MAAIERVQLFRVMVESDGVIWLMFRQELCGLGQIRVVLPIALN